ncbi:MAG: hypothetical protein ABW065_06130 [Solirubrobacterales bacterium]
MTVGRWASALFAIVTALLAVPTSSTATDSDLKFAYAFKVEASNGYEILAFAANERADGRGELVLFVSRPNEGASYVAPATLTATSLVADLGALGKVDLTVSPSGRKKSLRSRCDDERRPSSYEPPRFSGSFEFHGEEGYTEAASAPPRDYTRFFADLLCSSTASVEGGGRHLLGARLRLRERRVGYRLDLQANENHPGGRSRFEVGVRETRGGIAITRDTRFWWRADAFRFDPSLRTAHLEPPVPFAGRAIFHRHADPGKRWTGNLTVDLPGRSDVPLTGSGITATLKPACFQGEGAGRRGDCTSR